MTLMHFINKHLGILLCHLYILTIGFFFKLRYNNNNIQQIIMVSR